MRSERKGCGQRLERKRGGGKRDATNEPQLERKGHTTTTAPSYTESSHPFIPVNPNDPAASTLQSILGASSDFSFIRDRSTTRVDGELFEERVVLELTLEQS